MKRRLTIRDLLHQNVEAIAQMQRRADQNRSLGEWLADWVAAVVGSWPFILVQAFLLVLWMVVNVVGWLYHWDPYPFILLNLVLSFQAAFASPIIMMSQNRQARLDARREQLDLQINLLAEREDTETLKLLHLLCEKAGIRVDRDPEEAALEQATNPEEVIQQIYEAEHPQSRQGRDH
jgi:uncharacterized membrane protein